MLRRYIEAALATAVIERTEEGWYAGEIPGCQGVWSSAATETACRQELEDVLSGWILLAARLGHELPVFNGIDLNAKKSA